MARYSVNPWTHQSHFSLPPPPFGQPSSSTLGTKRQVCFVFIYIHCIQTPDRYFPQTTYFWTSPPLLLPLTLTLRKVSLVLPRELRSVYLPKASVNSIYIYICFVYIYSKFFLNSELYCTGIYTRWTENLFLGPAGFPRHPDCNCCRCYYCCCENFSFWPLTPASSERKMNLLTYLSGRGVRWKRECLNLKRMGRKRRGVYLIKIMRTRDQTMKTKNKNDVYWIFELWLKCMEGKSFFFFVKITGGMWLF